MKLLKSIFILFCVVFTIATLAGCVINLFLGQTTDTYAHIIDRAVLTFMGSLVFVLMRQIKWKNPWRAFFVPYGIFISLVLLYVFLWGFFVPLHSNAYRDVFLNDTIAYAAVYLTIWVCDRRKSAKQQAPCAKTEQAV